MPARGGQAELEAELIQAEAVVAEVVAVDVALEDEEEEAAPVPEGDQGAGKKHPRLTQALK